MPYAPDARDYLTLHKVEETLKDAITDVLKTKPDAPLNAIADKIKSSGYTFLTIQPTFTIKDWEAARPVMDKFVELTKSETGCVYYGWTKVGDKLFCREAYGEATGVLAHIDNVGATFGAFLESGAATLDKIELHGPKEELEKCKTVFDAFGTAYWEIDSGFQNYAM